MPKDIQICIGVDVDAVAGWLGSYGGQDSPNDIQRGMFAGEVGSPRLLRLFDKYELRTSWFVPGHSIETFPDQMRAVADAGHEIGAHGYSHENPIAMSPQQERDVLAKSIELIEELSGRAPRGYVAPWWELSEHTASLLLDNGFSYDHSQNYNDFTPFYARVGDSWTKVGRPAADDVYQTVPEQSRFRQSTRHRAAVAGPVRLDLPRDGLRSLPGDPASRCLREAPGAADAGTPHRVLARP
jgi:peptidoglycan/xylan/chitin deacetylase (PgdA/CDA1 family)